MYARAFTDLDGHIREPMFVDPDAMRAQTKAQPAPVPAPSRA